MKEHTNNCACSGCECDECENCTCVVIQLEEQVSTGCCINGQCTCQSQDEEETHISN